MKVVMVERPKKKDVDLSGLTEWGEETYLFGADDRRPGVFNPDAYVESLKNALLDLGFDSDVDCLCMTGNMLQVAFALTAAMQLYGGVNMLMYNARECAYVKKTMKGRKDDRRAEEGVNGGGRAASTDVPHDKHGA